MKKYLPGHLRKKTVETINSYFSYQYHAGHLDKIIKGVEIPIFTVLCGK